MSFAEIDGYRLAYRYRQGRAPSLVFVHGLGVSKDSFDRYFEEDMFSSCGMASIDLPGCGQSSFPKDFSYTMADQAGVVLKWIKELELSRIILIGHSMGGVICLHVAESLKEEVVFFLNLEGNLGFEDCTFSRHIASMRQEEFEDGGFAGFRESLKHAAEKGGSPGLMNYYRNIQQAYPRGLYLSSVSLVRESRDGQLRGRFEELPTKKRYVFGEKSMNSSSRRFFDNKGIPYFIMPESGHFMMDDQPELFRDLLLDVMATV
jgi:pimeloyl-ACP methyl ester carboxylesterase